MGQPWLLVQPQHGSYYGANGFTCSRHCTPDNRTCASRPRPHRTSARQQLMLSSPRDSMLLQLRAQVLPHVVHALHSLQVLLSDQLLLPLRSLTATASPQALLGTGLPLQAARHCSAG